MEKKTRKPKNETLTLECQLTDKEKLGYSKELGEALSKKNRAEDSLKSFQTQAKSDIAGLEAKINSLADKINTGREYRSVECEVIMDFEKKEKIWTRKDTGEIAKTDIISEHELQEEIEI
jgi:hypothetical protein